MLTGNVNSSRGSSNNAGLKVLLAPGKTLPVTNDSGGSFNVSGLLPPLVFEPTLPVVLPTPGKTLPVTNDSGGSFNLSGLLLLSVFYPTLPE
jgi:hypothetical protein